MSVGLAVCSDGANKNANSYHYKGIGFVCVCVKNREAQKTRNIKTKTHCRRAMEIKTIESFSALRDLDG